MRTQLPVWSPEAQPLYDIGASYGHNMAYGPFFEGEIPERPSIPKEKWIDFLGYKIKSPLGVPAGPLLHERWTTLTARLGFDVVTYKTIRSGDHPCHPHPNIICVDTHGQLDKSREGGSLQARKEIIRTQEEIAITNSFGMPSRGRIFLEADIAKAKAALDPGQLLIVSVVGSPQKSGEFIDDFVYTALLAKSAGAECIEANFSCPNVCTGEGSIYTNPKSVYEIANKIVKEIKDTPLIIKLGFISDQNLFKQVLVACSRAGVRAVCGINTIGMNVVNEKGNPALGPDRLKSGICGAPIREAALNFTRSCRGLIDSEKLGLELIATGGVTKPEHFRDLLDAGANVVMSATGMMWDPYLAMRYHYNQW